MCMSVYAYICYQAAIFIQCRTIPLSFSLYDLSDKCVMQKKIIINFKYKNTLKPFETNILYLQKKIFLNYF